MAYATYTDVAAGFRPLTPAEQSICTQLLDEAAIIIDAYNVNASADAKKLVSCRMVRRALGSGVDGSSAPMGATQGSMSALGYSQSWTISNGSSGELYLGRTDKYVLGVSNKIGSYSPVERMAAHYD